MLAIFRRVGLRGQFEGIVQFRLWYFNISTSVTPPWIGIGCEERFRIFFLDFDTYALIHYLYFCHSEIDNEDLFEEINSVIRHVTSRNTETFLKKDFLNLKLFRLGVEL